MPSTSWTRPALHSKTSVTTDRLPPSLGVPGLQNPPTPAPQTWQEGLPAEEKDFGDSMQHTSLALELRQVHFAPKLLLKRHHPRDGTSHLLRAGGGGASEPSCWSKHAVSLLVARGSPPALRSLARGPTAERQPAQPPSASPLALVFFKSTRAVVREIRRCGAWGCREWACWNYGGYDICMKYQC